MDDLSWMNHPAIKDIDKRKLDIIVEFAQMAQGKSGMAMMVPLMQAQRKMQEQGLLFTDSETDLLQTILTQNMKPEEKARVNQMRQMAEKYKSQK